MLTCFYVQHGVEFWVPANKLRNKNVISASERWFGVIITFIWLTLSAWVLFQRYHERHSINNNFNSVPTSSNLGMLHFTDHLIKYHLIKSGPMIIIIIWNMDPNNGIMTFSNKVPGLKVAYLIKRHAPWFISHAQSVDIYIGVAFCWKNIIIFIATICIMIPAYGVFYGSQTTKWGSISSLLQCSLWYIWPRLCELLIHPR